MSQIWQVMRSTCFLRPQQKVHKNLFQRDVLAQSTAIRLVSADKQENMAQFPAIKIICKIARVLKQIYRCMGRKSHFCAILTLDFGAMSWKLNLLHFVGWCFWNVSGHGENIWRKICIAFLKVERFGEKFESLIRDQMHSRCTGCNSRVEKKIRS